jgi:hypothetical protein
VSERQRGSDDSDIDFGEIPSLTGKQLANRARRSLFRLVALLCFVALPSSGVAFQTAHSSPQPGSIAQERAQLSFCSGNFSPDLRYLAVQTTGIVSGDPEQVWRYELATGRLVPVTPRPTAASLPAIILSLHWAGDVLRVTGIDRASGRQFHAELPEQGSPSVTYTQPPSPGLQTEDSLRYAGRYTLTPTVLHGGSTTWTAQLDGTGPHRVIAGALLNTPIVNPTVPFFFYVPVTYPTTFNDDTVAALDLRTGRQTTQRLPASYGLQLLAVAPDASGFLLAYQVMGSCEPLPNQDGEDSEQINGFGGLPFQRQAVHVCFLHLPVPAIAISQ